QPDSSAEHARRTRAMRHSRQIVDNVRRWLAACGAAANMATFLFPRRMARGLFHPVSSQYMAAKSHPLD
ncbi:MAG: hypothetical protein ACJ0HE_01075, partial [Anaerolineales bacterium]